MIPLAPGLVLLLAVPARADLPLPEIVQALRAGGHVIYFRHGATDWRQSDDREALARDERRLSDCALQRNLSEEGHAQARAIGAGLRDLAIPIGAVLSGPFCRCLETARIAFGAVTVEPNLIYHVIRRLRSAAEGDAVIVELRRRLAAMPPPGVNTVIAGHHGNLLNATGVTIDESGAAIFRPDGSGGFALVGTVRPEEWLASAVGVAPPSATCAGGADGCTDR